MKKSLIIAMLASFLFQTQAIAAIDNESEILAGKAQRSVPMQDKNSKSDKKSGKISLLGSNGKTEVVSDADWQKEILSDNAKRSVPMETKQAREERKAKEKKERSDQSKIDKKDKGNEVADNKNQQELKVKQENKTEINKPVDDASPNNIPSSSIIQEKKPEVENNLEKADLNKEKVQTPAIEKEQKTDKSKAKQKIKKSKKNRQENNTSRDDWEREILGGKAQRSVSVN